MSAQVLFACFWVIIIIWIVLETIMKFFGLTETKEAAGGAFTVTILSASFILLIAVWVIFFIMVAHYGEYLNKVISFIF